MQRRPIPDKLKKIQTFSRKEYSEEMRSIYGLAEQQSKYDIQTKLDRGEIIRVGWNQYTAAAGKERYRHDYSNASRNAAKKILDTYPDAKFQIFEMIQLNQFVNHLIAHNTVFVSVENELIDYVFDTLNKEYPGRVMLKPSPEMYYRYYQDDEIVVGRLPSEAPRGFTEEWHSRIEKIIVDVLVDKFISKIVPEGEKPAIVDGAYRDFLIDEGTMIRYAKRKGAEQKLVSILKDLNGEYPDPLPDVPRRNLSALHPQQ